MKIEASIYTIGNTWQKKVYKHMAEYLESKDVCNFGASSKGNQCRHLLTENDALLNFLNDENILALTRNRFSDHKAGDLNRILTNTAASQPYCFNLFLYLSSNKDLSNALFSELFGKPVSIRHIEPEFTPNKLPDIPGFEMCDVDESIGDQTKHMGTDADVAVFYNYEGKKKGVLLIEFKFIEPGFSICGSYPKKEDVRPVCDSNRFYDELILNKKKNSNNRFLCGYNKYENWHLSAISEAIDIEKIKSSAACPFCYGVNQLWRNMLLAERVADVRKCDEFGFWVTAPKPNDDFLWKDKDGNVEDNFRQVLTTKGQTLFRKIYLEDIFDIIGKLEKNQADEAWLQKMSEKYLNIEKKIHTV